jgi:hypothetical protein
MPFSQAPGTSASGIGHVHHPEHIGKPGHNGQVEGRYTGSGSKYPYIPRHHRLPSYVSFIYELENFWL